MILVYTYLNGYIYKNKERVFMKLGKVLVTIFLILQFSACSFYNDGIYVKDNEMKAQIFEECKYDFNPYGDVILRNENYTYVKYADDLLEDEREEYGFWKEYLNSSKIAYEDKIFCTTRIVLDSEKSCLSIKRYDSSAEVVEIFRTSELTAVGGNIRLLYVKGEALYFIFSEDSSYIYKINNCVSDDYQIEKIMTIDSDNIITLSDSYEVWFSDSMEKEAENNAEIRIFSADLETGKISLLNDVNNYILSHSDKIDCLEKRIDNVMIISAYTKKASNSSIEDFSKVLQMVMCKEYYAVDVKTGKCTLLCKNTVLGKEFTIVDGYFYHIHKGDDDKGYLARAKLDDLNNCQIINNSELEDTLSDSLYVHNNHIIYTYASGAAYYVLYAETQNGFSEKYQSIYKPYIKYEDNKLFMLINGKVIYTDSEHGGTWYDSGIEFERNSSHDLIAYFYQNLEGFDLWHAENDFYLTYFDYWKKASETGKTKVENLSEVYSTKQLNVDFKQVLVTQNNPLFNPNLTVLQPLKKENSYAVTLENSICDFHTNSFYNAYKFLPISGQDEQLEYITNGNYKTMTVSIGATYNASSNCEGHFEIYADNNLVYTSDSINLKTKTQELNVDINYAEKVIIKAVSDKDYVFALSAEGMMLFTSLPYFHNLDKLPHNCCYKYFNLTDEEILQLVEEKIKNDSDIQQNYNLEISGTSDENYIFVWVFEDTTTAPLISTYKINKMTKAVEKEM